jgi:hypothetical protein
MKVRLNRLTKRTTKQIGINAFAFAHGPGRIKNTVYEKSRYGLHWPIGENDDCGYMFFLESDNARHTMAVWASSMCDFDDYCLSMLEKDVLGFVAAIFGSSIKDQEEKGKRLLETLKTLYEKKGE